MKSSIRIRRFLNKLLGKEWVVVGNGPEEFLVIFPKEVFSIDSDRLGGRWIFYPDSIRKMHESTHKEDFVTPNEKDKVIKCIVTKYGSGSIDGATL